jgi:hypothetical protein
MKVDPHIDELLCGFIDGELSLRQQTEVQRMAARDPEVAQRLEQLRNCRTLISVLPRAEAPSDMLEQIKASLERHSLLDERPIVIGTRAGSRHLTVRRFLATAAMIALVGALAFVVYQILAPVSPVATPYRATVAENAAVTQPKTPTPTPTVVADSRFSGRLELATASFTQADSFIKTSIEDNGLSGLIEPNPAEGRTVYRVSGNREKLNGFLADLDTIRANFRSARLIVDTDSFADPVVVDSVAPSQVAKIINQNTNTARVQMAKDIATLNKFAQEMPGREVRAATAENLDQTVAALSSIPRPRLASQDRKYPTTQAPLEGVVQVKASLTIILLLRTQ